MGHRYAGSEAEREMLHKVRSELPQGVRSRIEGFVAFTSPAWIIAIHALLLLVAGTVGIWWPGVGFIACAVLTVSFFAEGMGRFSALRRVLPKSASYNLVVPSDNEDALGTIVLVTPLDVPRWRPNRPWWMSRPHKWVFVAAMVVTTLLSLSAMAQPWGRPTQSMYAASLGVLGFTVVIGAMAQRRTGEKEGHASGVVALLELVRRFEENPVAGVQLWSVFSGCGHAYQNGTTAFLAMRGERLDRPVLVIALEEPGVAPLTAVGSEGPLLAQHHRPTGLALVERMRWAGIELETVDRPGVTDARAAMLFGYRALALAGGDGPETPEAVLHAVDLTERLVRLYAEDLARIERQDLQGAAK